MRHFFSVVVAVALMGCSDGTGPDVIPAELAGSWVARPSCLPNCGFTVTPLASPGDSLNLIQAYGITMNLTLSGSGRIQLVALGGTQVDPITGQVTVEGETLILRDGGGSVDTVDYQITGGRLRLAFRERVLLNGAQSSVTGVFQRP